LGTVLIFCSESQRAKLTNALESLADACGQGAALSKLYEDIVTCARDDFRHR
jgi:hypothetical protein